MQMGKGIAMEIKEFLEKEKERIESEIEVSEFRCAENRRRLECVKELLKMVTGAEPEGNAQ